MSNNSSLTQLFVECPFWKVCQAAKQIFSRREQAPPAAIMDSSLFQASVLMSTFEHNEVLNVDVAPSGEKNLHAFVGAMLRGICYLYRE